MKNWLKKNCKPVGTFYPTLFCLCLEKDDELKKCFCKTCIRLSNFELLILQECFGSRWTYVTKQLLNVETSTFAWNSSKDTRKTFIIFSKGIDERQLQCLLNSMTFSFLPLFHAERSPYEIAEFFFCQRECIKQVLELLEFLCR